MFAATTEQHGYRAELPTICRQPVPLRDAEGAPGPAPAPEPRFAEEKSTEPYNPVVPPECITHGDGEATVVRICVSTEGKVSGVTILRESLPIIDSQLPTVIGRRKYHAYLQDGKPTPFCYTMTYHMQ